MTETVHSSESSDSTLDDMLDRLTRDGWSCGWHMVVMQDGSQQVVIEGKRKNVTLIWRWTQNHREDGT